MKTDFLSATNICIAQKPIEGFIILMDENDEEISRKRVTKEPEKNCRFCGKPWDKHN